MNIIISMRKLFLLIIVCLLFVVPLFSVSASSKNNISKVFKELRANTIWPVKNSDNNDIISPFGPRWIQQYTCRPETHDWHSGLDIEADESTKVKAVSEGEVYEIAEYDGAGNTVILKHELPSNTKFHGQSVEYYYTWYAHLQGFKDGLEVGDTVKKGKVIGYVGQTGNASSPHLHLELHIGSPWSYVYDDSYGFDSAINPMMLFEPDTKSMMVATVQLPSENNKGEFGYVTKANQPLLNRVKFTIRKKSDNKVIKQHVLNLDTRQGYDYTSTQALDTADKTKPYLKPQSSPFRYGYYYMDIVIPKKYIQKYTGSKYKMILKVYDIWGRSKKITF